MMPSLPPIAAAEPKRERQQPAPAPEIPAAAPAAAATAANSSKFILGVVAGTTPGQRFRLMASGCTVGRQKGAILFPDDPFVSAQHATFRVREGSLSVRDEGSISGVYLTISRPEPIRVGARFCIGNRVLRYVGPIATPSAQPGKPVTYGAPIPQGSTFYLVEELLTGGRAGRAVIAPGAMTFGLDGCDFAFPKDSGVASRHCELSPTPQGAVLRDLSGGLGTFVQVEMERAVQPGDRVRLGQQILLVELSGDR
jgi:pSer/pThr/pTyr-binding forkhead associated (FHA) protein